MNQLLKFSLVAIFSIFIGAQITEGVLLVPYWQSLSANEFHAYYDEFGPSIGMFFTILTIVAALIPILLSIYCKLIKSRAVGFAFASSLFAILFVASFYLYFKGANQQFLQSTFTESELKNELLIWRNWHWGRVVAEVISLLFLMLALDKMEKQKGDFRDR